jgi:hypothetical protein
MKGSRVVIKWNCSVSCEVVPNHFSVLIGPKSVPSFALSCERSDGSTLRPISAFLAEIRHRKIQKLQERYDLVYRTKKKEIMLIMPWLGVVFSPEILRITFGGISTSFHVCLDPHFMWTKYPLPIPHLIIV